MRSVIFSAVMLVVFVVVGLNCAAHVLSSLNTSGTSTNENAESDYLFSDIKNHARNGNHQQVVKDATEMIEVYAEEEHVEFYRGELYLLRAESYNKLGDNENAVLDYEKAILDYTEVIQRVEMKPEFEERNTGRLAKIYNQRAWICAYHLKRDFDQAIKDATKAIELKPEKAAYYDTRGWAYLGSGDYNSATDDFSKALQLDPNLESPKEGLQKIQDLQTAPSPLAPDLDDF
jgi:tetratricopeptide (TPR) repeat protein